MIQLTQLKDEEQEAAINAPIDGVLIVDAGAGSGKTTATTRRVKHLLNAGVRPDGILAMSFSRLSAASLSDRIIQIAEGGKDDSPILGLADMAVGTFHSLAIRLLKDHVHRFRQWEIVSETKRRLLVRRYYKWLRVEQVTGPARNKKQRLQNIKQYLSALDRLREECVAQADMPDSLRVALTQYRRLLGKKTVWDYTEVLRNFLAAISPDAAPESDALQAHLQNNLRAILIDEAQDLNTAMWQILYRLAETAADNVSVWIVGDEQQMIYGWRGAIPDGFARFLQQFPEAKRHVLSSNYRSSNGPISVATHLLEHVNKSSSVKIRVKPYAVKSHHEWEEGDIAALKFDTMEEQYQWGAKRLKTMLGVPYKDRADSAPRGLAQTDCAVLVREKRFIPGIVAALRAAGMEAIVKGEGGLFSSPEANMVAWAIYYAAGIANRSSMESVLSQSGLGLGEKQIASGISLLDKARAQVLTLQAASDLPGNQSQSNKSACIVQMLYRLLKNIGYNDTLLCEVAPARASLIHYNVARVMNAVTDYQHWNYHEPLPRRLAGLAAWLRDEAEATCDDSDSDESQTLVAMSPNAVTVSTIHSTKGLEWAVCWLPDVCENVFPAKSRPTNLRRIFGNRAPFDMARFDTESSSEAKVGYVALTRAAKYLFLTHAPLAVKGRKSMLGASAYFNQIAATENVTRDSNLLPTSARINIDGKLSSVPRRAQQNITLTFSQLFYYFLCPHQFYLRFLKGFPPPISTVIGYPKTLHDAAAELDKRLSAGETLHKDDLRDIAERHFKMPFASNNEKAVRLEAAQEALAQYALCYQAQGGVTEFVEREVRIDVGNITILGRIDRSYFTVEGKLRLVEHKTSHGAVERDKDLIQLQVYAAAYQAQTGRLPDEVAVNLIGVENAGEHEDPITGQDISFVKEKIAEAGAAITHGRFAADPTAEKCAKCDVRHICYHWQNTP